MSHLLLLPLLAHLASHLSPVVAQGTNATCSAEFDWMNNSKGQSPCLVSSFLFTPCSAPADSFVFPLSAGFHYNTPLNTSDSATPCRCNTVLFSTIAACATCQGQEDFIVPWNTYSQNCSQVFIQKYPANIPTGTAIPAWAYLDIATNNTFDPVAAEQVAAQDLPESTASVKPTSASNSASRSISVTGNVPSTTGDGATSLPSGTAAGSPSGDNDSSASKKSSNTGAIVGGVIGGIVALAAIGLGIFFLRQRRNKANQTAYSGHLDLNASGGGYDPYSQYPEKTSAPQDVTQPFIPHLQNQNSAPRLYNPNDPSTFPGAGEGYAGSTNTRSMNPSYHTGEPTLNSNHNPTYKGVPEL